MIFGSGRKKKPWERRVTIVVNCDRWKRLHKALLGDDYYKNRIVREVDFVIDKLKLRKGDAILDVPCGSGRHASALGKRGFDVTGVDLSRACLDAARDRKRRNRIGDNLRFRTEDILKLDRRYRNKFDAVLTLFSAYGFMPSEKGNIAAMKRLVACLKKGGHICFRTIDLDHVYRHHQTRTWDETKEYIFLRDYEFYDDLKYMSMDMAIISKEDGSIKKYYNWVRAYGKSEFVRLMMRHGLGNIRVFGSYGGERYKRGVSISPIYIGQKM